MDNKNTTAETKVAKSLNGEQINDILASLRTMHAIVWDAGTNEHLPTDFNTLTHEQLGIVCVRALKELAKQEKRAKDAAEQKVRQALEGVLASHFATARKDKAEYDALSASMKARLGAFPTFVAVPVEQLQGVFATSNASAIVKKLHDLGVKVDGRSIGKAKNVTSIAIPFSA